MIVEQIVEPERAECSACFFTQSAKWKGPISIFDVAVQNRAGADKAKAELNGILLHELELKIGWGKSIVIPPAPLYMAASVGVASAAAKPSRAAVPPPGVEAAPPWTDPHKDDQPGPVGKQPHAACAS